MHRQYIRFQIFGANVLCSGSWMATIEFHEEQHRDASSKEISSGCPLTMYWEKFTRIGMSNTNVIAIKRGRRRKLGLYTREKVGCRGEAMKVQRTRTACFIGSSTEYLCVFHAYNTTSNFFKDPVATHGYSASIK
jgi:hypothetical protein